MKRDVGISGFAVYVPPYRVSLEDWCQWTGAPWEKTRAVVGNSFRMRGPRESVYTLAGTAVMRLIERYGVDPGRIGFLGLGTESSTDNSAGAVIVKGMLDQGLAARGMPAINRYCEVPEVKHACLGAIYALKYGLRYLALEDDDRCAIVVSSDIAEYARGSSGEPTQGAGAVAMLLERDPELLSVNLKCVGSASSYRAVDFRKPVLAQPYSQPTQPPLPGSAGFQRQVLHHVLSGRDDARAWGNDAPSERESRQLLPRTRRRIHAPTLPSHAAHIICIELSVRIGERQRIRALGIESLLPAMPVLTRTWLSRK